MSSVSASELVFSNISVFAENKQINQCVREVNQASEENLDTATRLYRTGMCYFCIDCNFAEDNGQIFLANDISHTLDGMSSEKNYETAQKLITQAAGLGNIQAYYGLAVLLFAAELSDSHEEVNEIEGSSENMLKVSQIDEMHDDGTEASANTSIFQEIIQQTPKSKFSQQIHRHLLVAAKQGYMAAQFALSEVFAKGIGVDKNAVQAYAWAATAVAQNPPFGSLRRDEKAAVLDNIKLNQAESLAEDYMKRYTNIFDRASVTVMR